MKNDPQKVIVDFSGEVHELKCALIGGRMANENRPTSMYIGPLDLDEIHTSIYFINRTAVKLLMDEFGISLELAEEFLLSAVAEACTQEYNIRARNDEDLEIHKITRAYRKSQN